MKFFFALVLTIKLFYLFKKIIISHICFSLLDMFKNLVDLLNFLCAFHPGYSNGGRDSCQVRYFKNIFLVVFLAIIFRNLINYIHVHFC